MKRDITTNRSSIFLAQQYLNRLHYSTNGEIPLVNPDGIFGPETTEAVMKFQSLFGLDETGSIDYATWNALYESFLLAEHESIRPQALNLFPDEPSYQVQMGENSDIVAIIQFVLRALGDEYDSIEGMSPSGVYDEATMKDIREFQRLNMLPETGLVDRRTWNLLAAAYNRMTRGSYDV